MSTTKLTGRENLTKYAFWAGPFGPTDKEVKLICIKNTILVHYRFEMARIHIRIKQSDPDPYQIDKQDLNPYQSAKQDLDPHHCF
jgi:hypothetical protein